MIDKKGRQEYGTPAPFPAVCVDQKRRVSEMPIVRTESDADISLGRSAPLPCWFFGTICNLVIII